MFALALSLALATDLTPTARAADDEPTDLDGGEETAPAKKRKVQTTKVREITRGTYAKSNVGGAFYVGNFAGATSAGSMVGASFGKDFVDHERSSMAWEVSLSQGLHNGLDAASQGDINEDAGFTCVDPGRPAPCTQGDLRTYAVTAAYEYSFYPTRRVGIGVRVGGGALYSPLLIPAEFWAETVVDKFGGGDPGYHNSVKPIVLGGPTVEYYTKLSHFSVGADVDVVYGIGWDLSVNTTGTLKYTF
jgi:hypothetical protein